MSQQTAIKTMPDPALAEAVAACDREPIHIPGAIQPHGVLLALREPQLELVQASSNLPKVFDQPLTALLGQTLDQLLDVPSLALVKSALQGELPRSHYLGVISIGGERYDALLHRHDGLLILELETPQRGDGQAFSQVYPLVRAFVDGLSQTADLSALCGLAAQEMRRITGFGRVLVYRFDEEGHSQVLGESLAEGYDSYLDLRFPASDIPQQARRLYQLNPLRLIADANYQPAPLTPPLNPLTDQPTDLSFAWLRSVSPVHLQYLRNMGTLASMSVSVMVRGRLWGLISCHHHEPHSLGVEGRTACEHLGQIFSLRVEALEERADSALRLELRRGLVQLLAAMADNDSFVSGLAADPGSLLSFAAAEGAAIVFEGRCLRLGDTPPEPQLIALSNWLSTQMSDDGVYASAHLAQDYEPAAQQQWAQAGLLAVSISELHDHCLLWFRPEVVRTVKWAGNPEKPMSASEAQPTSAGPAQLHPRKSFEAWTQTLSGQSLPWPVAQLDVAAELRNAVLAIVLRRAEQLAAMANELERSNRELEAFSYSVSHDLRAPLRHITGYSDLLREFEGDQLSERGNRFLLNIEESARFAGALVDDLLSFSQMGRSALRPIDIDMNRIVSEAIYDLRKEAEGRDIRWTVAQLPMLQGDAMFIHLAIRNLLSNAVKYTRSRAAAEIAVETEESDGAYTFHVRDNGVGFNMKYVGKLFGVFQRLHRMEDFEGTGIGLANVRRIVERHGGQVWASGEIDRGATFSFSLPKQPVIA